MTNSQNGPTKAEVQSTELNKLPVPGENDTEFSAEEAAEVFQQNGNAELESENEE
ncbi:MULTISPECIES: hypothetical protein [Paenibacillus]|jgi:hypothetical protein|uniref:Uncharacterized protein n=1 Tax=Paenibacillus oceani TaxID=2772510 RepID=A0A927CEG7_9BACL|nr:hypothetical protein [Paenibacillus oceani]MBD2866578.1 hypothetical protein [Paenibacillus oceani]MDF2661687.1 hypothetical protein [Paenibacillus sp.]